MKEIENLQNRVGLAVQKLSHSEQQRQSNNKSLSRVLNDLEIKFEARKVELDHCRSRISQLEESNKALTGLVAEMVEIVERTADGLAEDPVYRTTAGATEIINRYVGDVDPISEPVSGQAAVEDVVEVAAEEPAGDVTGEEILAAHGATFEDVDEAAVRAEDLADETAAFPKLVYDAMALASAEQDARVLDMEALEEIAAESVDEEAGVPAGVEADTGIDASAELDMDIPEPMEPEPVSADLSTGNLDIKEIMARLEAAAERAQLRADADARQHEVSEPGRAVGGRA